MSDIHSRVFQYIVEKLLDLLTVIAAVALTWHVVEWITGVTK